MIAYFPELYPNELLYSGVARLCKRLGFSHHRFVLNDLFRATNVSALIDLPRNINQLLSELLMQDRLASDELIDNHTLLPFYTPFVTSKRLKEVRMLSPVTSKPASRGRIKTGHSEVSYSYQDS
jgi:hypothetical protein